MTKGIPRRSNRFLRKNQIQKHQHFSASSVVKVKVELPVVVSGNSVTAKVKIEVPVATCSKRTKTKRKRNFEKSKLVRPTAEESIYATASLSKLHPEVIDKNDDRRKTMLETCGGQSSITDSVISTMLSQNTTDSNAKAAWSNLKKAFPDWNSVVDTDLSLIENAIKVAGLAKTRAERIQNILKTVKYETGEASLDYIRDYSDEQIKRELSRFKGLGPKTISCVLLFALGRDEFPVDTHVLRITQKMGWVSSGTSREQAYDYLNDSIPNKVKMDLHCLLVRHGKVCHRCAANGRPQFPPRDGNKLDCPLINVSTWGGKVPSMQKDIKIKVENHLIPDAVKS